MATLDRPPARSPLVPTPPAGVQPGGHGIAVRLELAWGRLRRVFLRRFRPAYVARLAALRRGSCPDCPHDIVDPRDLKFCRNVCGYDFGPDLDPYARRGPVPLARPGRAEVVVSGVLLLAGAAVCVGLALTAHVAFAAGAVAAITFWVFILSFFRDPERTPPTDADALVSPADGTVISVGEVDEPDFPGGRALRVALFLSPFNVHVNRVPRSGRVVGLRYLKGHFQAATRGDCDQVNEQFWLDIEEPSGRRVRVKQVAGAVARRIVCWLRPGEQVTAGNRYGMIKLGSRTDVLIPVGDATAILVKAGDAVRGAETVLLRGSDTRCVRGAFHPPRSALSC